MAMPNRVFKQSGDSSYRYGFNGKEEDNDIEGVSGVDYDFGERIYDSRLGRWLSVDPSEGKYPSQSPYSAFGNDPILFIDPDGADNIIYLFAADKSYTNGLYSIFKDGKLSAGDVYTGGVTAAELYFPPFGLFYGLTDLGFSLISGKSLTDRIHDGIDNKVGQGWNFSQSINEFTNWAF